MVHGVRAVYTYSDGTISVNPPDGDEDPVDIAYEEVDITKTARGAARQARQEARAKKQETKKSASGGPKRRRSSSKKEIESEDGHEDEGEDDDEEDAEGEDDDMSLEPSLPPPPVSTNRRASQTGGQVRTAQHLPTPPPLLTYQNGQRPPSTVQDLMSASSAANHGFSIGPTQARTMKERGNGNGNGSGSRSGSSESNERSRNGREPSVGDKRDRDSSEGGSRDSSGAGGRGTPNGVDKRLRLTGDTQSHELDPALRVLADATAAVASGRQPSIPGTSIAPTLTGISPHDPQTLDQRLHEALPHDIPVQPSTYSLPYPNQPAPRPFATSSTGSAASRGDLTRH